MIEVNGKKSYTPAEAAKMLGITPAGVRLSIQRGVMPAIRKGGRWYIPENVLLSYVTGERDFSKTEEES